MIHVDGMRTIEMQKISQHRKAAFLVECCCLRTLLMLQETRPYEQQGFSIYDFLPSVFLVTASR